MHGNSVLDDFDFEGNELPIWAEEGEVVAKFFSPMEAELAAARLRAEGLNCFLANATAQSVLPHLQTVLRLHVHPTDAAAAREILQEAAIDALESDRKTHSGNGVILILAIVIGVLLAFLLVRAISL